VFLLAAIFFLASCDITPTVTSDVEPITGTSTIFELYVVNDVEDAFNVVFVPDASYGDMGVIANRQTFADDVADVIENGYWQNQGYFNGWFHYNYYYMTASGSVVERTPDANGNFRCPTVTWPAAANTDGAFADQLLLIHSNELRDCGGGGRATAEPTSFRTVVHESGHGIFGLPDEYCCDGGYFVMPPVMYSSQSACTNDADNAGWRSCSSITSSRDSSVWWRSQGNITTNHIMSSGGDEVWESGPADWASMSGTYQTVGANLSVPSVLAPNRWDYNVPSSP
jgi:hypothetical protein